MAGLIDITRVVVGTEYLTATLVVSEDCPLRTSEDLEGTTRVYNLMPQIINHACMGDAGEIFRDCMGDTEICHLLEHMTVELLSRMDVANEVIAGRTWRELAYERTYSVQFPCIDDVLVTGALSSAIWILEWAFTGGVGPVPDIEATVVGLTQLAHSLPVKDQVADAIRAAEAQLAAAPVVAAAAALEDEYAGSYDDGYADGYAETPTSDYNDAAEEYAEGYAEGYADAYADAGEYADGYADGAATAYADSYADSYTDDYADGRMVDYADDEDAYEEEEEEDLNRGPRMSRKII